MSKSYLSTIIFTLVFLLTVNSCKRDDKNMDMTVIAVDFLMNDQDLDKFGLEYTEQDFERDSSDPNKILIVKVGEPVKFKDTSDGAKSESVRKWVLDEDEWKEAQDDQGTHRSEFTYSFDSPGMHRVSLFINEMNTVTKLMKVVSGAYIPADEQATDVVATTEPAKDDLFADSKTSASPPVVSNTTPSTSATQPQKTNATPEPAKPVTISNISFVAPSEITVGKSFELKDISSPSSAITVRQWDLGDGNTEKVRGSTYSHMYFSAGDKTITLCLNNTNQCTSKRIKVIPRPERKEEVAKNTNTPAPAVVKAPEVSKVEFVVPSNALVGTSVNFADRSQPSAAVLKRKWEFGDGTPDLNTGKGEVSHVFNKAGTYTVKLCVNDSNLCSTETIKIEDKPAVAEVKPKEAAKDEFDGSRTGRVGLLSSMKCDEQTTEWFEGVAFINLSPQKAVELSEVKVYGNSNGKVDIILTTGDKKQTGVINNIQVNPGPTVIYLTDLAVILDAGEKYTLMIKPSDKDSKLKLENSVKCSPKALPSKEMDVNYNNNFILYDLKYYY